MSSKHSKQKECANKIMKELQNLSKQIEIHNFTYRHKANNDLKTFIGFNVPLGFYKNIKEGYII